MTGRHRTMAAAVLCVDLTLLVATSEPPPAVDGPTDPPRCGTVDVRTDAFQVDAEGALVLELIADELGAVEGSVWVFADPERACRAEVSFGEDTGAGVVLAPGQGDGGGHAPAEAVASWIAAGSAWEVPVVLDGADGPVLVEVGACAGSTVELELAADACGEVDVVAR